MSKKGTGMEVTIRGIQAAQRANAQLIAAVSPDGAFGRAIREATAAVHRYAVSISHVDTGAMKASHRMQIRGLEGRVSLDQTARNPRSRVPTHEYGAHEHQRGGSHAFYERTYHEAGPGIARQAIQTVRRRCP